MPTISISAESTGRSILPLACYRKQLREPSHCRIHRFDVGLGKAGQDLGQGIEHQFEIIRNTLTSIPGIGKVYSAGIVAEIGDIHRFDSQASVAKYAGLVWYKNRSGNFEAEHSRMIKSGNRYLRYYLLEAANFVRRCDSAFWRYYDLKSTNTSTNAHSL
ncbi:MULTISPECIES: IS110 family transposase [Agathobaculum]|uniref:IS110 family transposase n=1 Tax=Agathobaculum ammoniilyticum TaxID=2981778 RepID=A0ABT2TZ42_9FIRM|nr:MULTISPECIES: IS110 family transposase [Agathobaculum]MCU6787635.1 IS110 family transposase [Agathobaculum ammoniilyticum]